MQLEELENRMVPTIIDLTTGVMPPGVNGALFQQSSPQPTGTGVIHSFVRVQANGNATLEQGYNTDARPSQFDEKTNPIFLRSIHLSELPVANIGGVNYRVLLLDINQDSAHPQLSLDELRIYVHATSPNLTGYDPATKQLGGQVAVYDLNPSPGDSNWIKLDARLSHGSGSGDMLAYIPDSSLAVPGVADPYVYVYSKFGANIAANGGFEEWAAPGNLLPLASVSGFVYVDANGNGKFDAGESGIANVTLTLTGVDDLGNQVSLTVQTGADGSYIFGGLRPGVYKITETQPDGFNNGTDSVGTVNGITDGAFLGYDTFGNDVLGNIVLKSGQNGINYNFGEVIAGGGT